MLTCGCKSKAVDSDAPKIVFEIIWNNDSNSKEDSYSIRILQLHHAFDLVPFDKMVNNGCSDFELLRKLAAAQGGPDYAAWRKEKYEEDSSEEGMYRSEINERYFEFDDELKKWLYAHSLNSEEDDDDKGENFVLKLPPGVVRYWRVREHDYCSSE